MFQCRTLFILILYVSFFNVVNAQTKEQLQIKKQNIQKEIELTNSLIRKAKKEKSLSLTTLSTINKQIKSRDEIISTIDLQIKMTITLPQIKD